MVNTLKNRYTTIINNKVEAAAVTPPPPASTPATAPLFRDICFVHQSKGELFLGGLPEFTTRNPYLLIRLAIFLSKFYTDTNNYTGSLNALKHLNAANEALDAYQKASKDADKESKSAPTIKNPCVYALVQVVEAAKKGEIDLPRFKGTALPGMLRSLVQNWYQNEPVIARLADLENKAEELTKIDQVKQELITKMSTELAEEQQRRQQAETDLASVKAREDDEDKLSISSAASTASLSGLRASKTSVLSPNLKIVQDSKLKDIQGKAPKRSKPAIYLCRIINQIDVNTVDGQIQFQNIIAAYDTIRLYITEENGRVVIPTDNARKNRLIASQLSILADTVEELVEAEAIAYHHTKSKNPEYVLKEANTINADVRNLYKDDGYLFEPSRDLYNQYRGWLKDGVKTAGEAKTAATFMQSYMDDPSLPATPLATTPVGSRRGSAATSVSEFMPPPSAKRPTGLATADFFQANGSRSRTPSVASAATQLSVPAKR
jgi:hypothetical protein